MEGPDVVETSDAEECEVFVFSKDAAHQSLTTSPPLIERVSVPITAQHHQSPSLLKLITRPDQSTDDEAGYSSPRKRIKVSHDVGSVSPGSTHSVTAQVSLLSDRPPNVHPIGYGPGSSSLHSRVLTRQDEGQTPMLSPPRDISSPSDCHSLFFPPGQPSGEHNSLVTNRRTRAHSVEPPSMTRPLPRSHSRSPSISTDHCSLFSSPRHRPTAPPQTSSELSYDQSSLVTQKLRWVASSPLTPISSPALFGQTLSLSPDGLQLPSPQRSQDPHLLASQPNSPAILPPVRLPPEMVLEDLQLPLGRYSLRRRGARQLNPYAYDKLLYKQQLQFHPDAIVKFRSPGRRPGSGRVGKDGTQDEFILPVNDLDEDGDYVDVEIEGGKNRRSGARSIDRNEGEVRPVDEGWLPEILKGLSSSDENDNEIHKLAKKIRKEREKAEAIARAEAKGTIVEARRVEKEARKAARRRPKPFPVRGDAEHVSAHFPSYELSPSPYLSSQAHPEPPSSVKSPPRPTPSPVSSRSPTSSSGHFRSPDFSGYLQQEDSYQFDDHDIVPRNVSPVHHSVAYSAPLSPSGPSTISSASAPFSDASRMDSGSDQSPIFEMSSRDKKRLRALKRMMPAAMIARQLGIAKTKTTQRLLPRTRIAVESSESEAGEVGITPGLARVRKGRYKDLEVKGDPESSDMERPTEVYDDDEKGDIGFGTVKTLFNEQSTISVGRIQRSPRPNHRDDAISLSDSSMLGSSEDSEGRSSDDRIAHQSLFERPPRGPSREKSLIDWMLSRTRDGSRSKARSKQTAGPQKSRDSGARRLNIVTSGARRYGAHHQTLLPFVKDRSMTPLTKRSSEQQDRIVQLDQDKVEERKQRKKRRKRQFESNHELVYNIHHNAMRITSKNRERESSGGRTALVVENGDYEFRQALDPGWKAEVERWNNPVSPACQPAANPAPGAPAVPRSRLNRRASRPRDEISPPFYIQYQKEPSTLRHRRIVIDMNITPLPSGVKFSTSSYIGKGFLHQLISFTSGNSEVAPPIFCSAQGFEIGPATSATVFNALLGPLFDRLVIALSDFRVDDMDGMKEWESVTRASSQLLSWLAVHTEDQEFVALEVALRGYLDGLLPVLESLETGVFLLVAHWFVVELSARLATGIKYRRGAVENGQLIRAVKQLIQRLLSVDLQPAFTTFHAVEADVDATSLTHRATELWVCLIHLLPIFKDTSGAAAPGHALWRLLADLHSESSPTGAEASEDLWRTLFNLCAVSQFSVHGLSTSVFRLPAAWDLVATALKKIILTANPERDHRLPQRTLKRRDEYLSFIVSRCFLLWSRWGWRLDDGLVMFKSLQEIFRSRNFANLLNERSAPMGFIENGDLQLLSKRDPNDTVFEIFLKMVVQAVYLLNASVELDSKQRSVHIKKLLQMAVPVSPVPFSRSAPPSVHSLSMLVNRFSAMAVAVHLDPTSSNVRFRIGQAKRCVSFKDADDHSRMACVYGMMNFAIIVRHHEIVGGLEEVLRWLGEMADVLMDEYKEEEAGSVRKQPTIALIQLLIGSVRRVVETPSLDKGQSRDEYPDPALLDGPWVTRVFNPRTDLITIQQTGVEIRMLVQSFLNARLKALPKVRPPSPPIIHSVESQESQDEYEKLFLDLNDEDLLAALGEEAETSTIADLKSKEGMLCKVLDKSITPAVYRLVCRHVSEKKHAKNETISARVADEWIDCWVGCANVLVQNKYKDWSLYMKLGQQSWANIIDNSWRRRVGLRFNLTLLHLDPGAYNKMKDDFVAVLLIATLSYRVTIEHEFISLVLSLDGLQHPLLRTAPLNPIPGTRSYEISSVDYKVAREGLIKTVFANTAGCLRAKADGESQAYVELVVMMLSTMRDIYQESADAKVEYGEFCRKVFYMLLSYPELVLHPRMSDSLAWGRREWNV